MSEDERRQARQFWELAMKYLRRYGERCAFLYAERNDPAWEAVDAKAARDGVWFGEACRDLALWCGDEDYEPSIRVLAGKVIQAGEDRAVLEALT